MAGWPVGWGLADIALSGLSALCSTTVFYFLFVLRVGRLFSLTFIQTSKSKGGGPFRFDAELCISCSFLRPSLCLSLPGSCYCLSVSMTASCPLSLRTLSISCSPIALSPLLDWPFSQNGLLCYHITLGVQVGYGRPLIRVSVAVGNWEG